MATPRTVNAKRRGRRKTKRKSSSRKRRVKAAVVAAPKRRRRRKVRAAKAVKASRKRTRRTTRRRRVKAWRGNSAGHAKAARKGWKRRRKAGRASTKRRPRRRAREMSEMVMKAPRRRRSRRKSSPRRRMRARRRSSSMMAPRRMRASMGGMGIGSLLITGGSLGAGFLIADGLDRLLATYNPSKPAESDKDKFRSDGAGTLGNVLNVGSRPGLVRAGAAVGSIAVPAAGAYYLRNRTAKMVLTSMAFGAGINALKLLVNNVVMPMLRPKDSSPAELQKSMVARLYPAEVAAAINGAKKNADGSERQPQLTASAGGGAGALSGAHALAGPGADYPTAAQALARRMGEVAGPGADYPTAIQSLERATGRVGAPWQPGPSSVPGPGPQPASADCGCSKATPFLGFVEGAPAEEPLYR